MKIGCLFSHFLNVVQYLDCNMNIRDEEKDMFAFGGADGCSHMQMWAYVRFQTPGSFKGLSNKTKEQ